MRIIHAPKTPEDILRILWKLCKDSRYLPSDIQEQLQKDTLNPVVLVNAVEQLAILVELAV